MATCQDWTLTLLFGVRGELPSRHVVPSLEASCTSLVGAYMYARGVEQVTKMLLVALVFLQQRRRER